MTVAGLPISLTASKIFADVLDRLGGISPDRIEAWPAPGTATEQDLFDANGRKDGLFELIDGVLVRKPFGQYESYLAGVIIGVLREFVLPRRLGVIGAPDGMCRTLPGQIREPDVAFTVWARVAQDYQTNPATPHAPDLAVEVISKSNTVAEINRKRSEFFQTGTRLMWVIYPVGRRIEVFTPESASPIILSQSDTLDGGSVLPGFSVSVAAIFAEADRPVVK